MLTFIKDQDLIYDTEKYDVILVGTSIYCDLKTGFQSKMRYKYLGSFRYAPFNSTMKG